VIVQLATLGPLGRLKAPGTWGSAAGVLWWALVVRLAHAKGGPHEFIFDALVVLMAICICGVAAAFIGKKDPSEVILDEFAAMPLVFLMNPMLDRASDCATQRGLLLILLGFLFFRLFDITKPFGIKALEKLPGGFGIVLDDVMAAFYANLALQGVVLILKFTA
jgi:phosphatidylglycerophosphatase A